MPLVIDATAANRVVSEDDFRQWAADHSVFLSSVMGELAGERKLVAAALEDAGFTVRWFEGFGGTDDPPDIAYLTEVAGSDIYIGIVADDYGTMQKSGFSPTHEEYHEARRHGKRVSFWVKSDDGERDGHARKFVREVYVFNTAGSFADGADLAAKLIGRLKGMAAEDLSPWVKVGDVVFRAEDINEAGTTLTIRGRIRDQEILAGLRNCAPDDRWGRSGEARVTYGNRSGIGRVETFQVQTQAAATQTVTIAARVEWATGRDSMATGINGLSHEEVVEAGIRAGYLHEPLPPQLSGLMSGMADTADPLTQLLDHQLPEGALSPIARLLAAEHLVGGRKAASVSEFVLGPAVSGRRRLRITWTVPRAYTNVEPGSRTVEGDRPW